MSRSQPAQPNTNQARMNRSMTPVQAHSATNSLRARWRSSSLTLMLLCLGLGQVLPAHAQKQLPPIINEALPNPPTLEVSHSPATFVPGQSYSMSWLATGSGVSISYVCTSAGTGYKASGTVSGLSGSLTGIADAAWAAYPTTCTWTARNGGGSEVAGDYLVTQAPKLVNGSSVGAVSVPTSMVAGRSYSASVSMTNTGTSTWQPGVWKLGSQGPMDNTIWGTNRIALSAPVVPGASTTFNFTVTAPATAGTANFQWGMLQEGEAWFGPTTGARTITITAPPPAASISASHSPATLTAGQTFAMSWSSSNASSVSYSCSNSSGVVLSGSNLATSGTLNNTAQASWVNNAPRCTWSATGTGGNGSASDTLTTNPAGATISASHSPATLTAGQTFSMTWSSSNASSVSYSCSNSSGVVLSGSNLATSGTLNNTAQASWVNNAPRCTWNATGTGGNGSASDTLTTNSVLLTISASHNPAPLVAGQAFSMSWSSTNATSVSYSCSNGGGLVLSGSSQSASGSVSATALAGWSNDAPQCTWTATNGSSSVTARDILTTSALPAAPVINGVTRNPATLVAGSPFTVSWSSSNATSMAYTCTPNGGSAGYNNSASNLAASSNFSDTAAASWGGTSSTCVWTATGAGGATAKYTETVTTTVPVVAEVVTYVHTDGLGSPVAKSDANGNLISGSRTRYEPYGATAAGATPTIGFTGHVNDAATGLIYMQQRYYDPYAGRFLSTDPVLTDGNTGSSFNRYVYANNNPYKYIDRDGRESEPFQMSHLLDLPWVNLVVTTFQTTGTAAADLSAFGIAKGTGDKALEGVANNALASHQDAALGLALGLISRKPKYTPGGKFSPSVKKLVAERANNTCQYCGTKTVPAKKSEKGVTPPKNEGQTDHVDPASNGGPNSPENAAHACRKCNRDLSNTPKDPPPPPPPEK